MIKIKQNGATTWLNPREIVKVIQFDEPKLAGGIMAAAVHIKMTVGVEIVLNLPEEIGEFMAQIERLG